MVARKTRRVEWILEGLGLNPMTSPLVTARHQLLKPLGLRLADKGDKDADDAPVWLEGDKYLVWQDFEVEDAQPAHTSACLWDFISAADASPSSITEFTKRWGLLTCGPEDRFGWISLESWRREATVARGLVLTMAASEAGEMVSDSIWRDLAENEFERVDYTDEDFVEVTGLGVHKIYDAREHLLAFQRGRKNLWDEYRRSGEGVEYQARLVANKLTEWCSSLMPDFIWDAQGRRVETLAWGVKEVVSSQLYSLFTSGQLDIFACSVCGKPFLFDESTAERRPRSGLGRFCSDSCRQVSRKESNRLSWHKNREKWRPRKVRPAEAEEGGNGQKS